jgi:hypothetical protein
MDPRVRTQRSAALIALALALLLPGCGSGDGESLYRAGRFEEAHAAFVAVSGDEGDAASPELLVNRALAALRAGDLRDAEASAERAAARGGPDFEALRDFLRGNAAFARAVLAERQADTPEAEPFAFDIAIRYARGALEAWKLAAASRSDWPEARRNVERANHKIAELERKKEEKVRDPRRERAPGPAPIPEPPSDAGGATTEEEVTTEAQRLALTPEQVARLFERLAEKEREKREIRQAWRRERMADGERDW